MRRLLRASLIALLSLASVTGPALAQSPASPIRPVASYADLADLALAAPIIAEVRITKTQRIKDAEATGLPPGRGRLLVTADVERLLIGTQGLPGTIRYLVDMPLDARGRLPKLKQVPAIVFLTGDPGRADGLRLVGRDAQIASTPEALGPLRTLLEQRQTPAGTVHITGITSAFHVPGAVPGESETQIFLSTADRRPVSLSILRRPGEQPRWSVALGDFVDDAAGPPMPNTLLWYRLACSLPPMIGEDMLDRIDPQQRPAVRADYQLVMEALGPCGRTPG